MKQINEYLKENNIVSINEMLTAGIAFIAVLCGACALHFGIKLGRKITKYAGNFWDWAIGEKDIDASLSMTSAKESLMESEDKFDKSKVQPMQIDTAEHLQMVVDKSKPKMTKEGGKGFYIFQQLFKEDPEFKKLNKAPYYPNYVIFMDPGSEDNPNEKPNFYGMLGFSLKYWEVVAKKGKTEEIKNIGSEFKKYINIFAVQTDPQYAKQGLFEIYLESLKKACKEVKADGLTIKLENDDLSKVFEKYGFKKIEGLDKYMSLTLKKKKDEKA